ncbi:MAG: oxidoreductase NAD-binding domain protein [Bacillales bacterium]|nr:oxidoreductase NAD-binding domain protein [Bacillales bacterium]
MAIKELMRIVQHNEIAENIFRLTVQGKLTKQVHEPGRFLHVKVSEGTTPLLRRPISIYDVDHEKKELTMIYRVEGQGTKLLSTRRVNEKLDILGPLGKGFPVEKAVPGEEALLIGGGIGVPPLYNLAKQLVKKGVKVTVILGFQTESVSILKEEFEKFGDVYLATVDGTIGTKGFVTDVIQMMGIKPDITYACGPKPMLKALKEQLPNERLYISLEERMGCGVGACLACVCKVPNDLTGYKKVCSDGPVFQAEEVVL